MWRCGNEFFRKDGDGFLVGGNDNSLESSKNNNRRTFTFSDSKSLTYQYDTYAYCVHVLHKDNIQGIWMQILLRSLPTISLCVMYRYLNGAFLFHYPDFLFLCLSSPYYWKILAENTYTFPLYFPILTSPASNSNSKDCWD